MMDHPPIAVAPELATWLDSFRQKKGRSPSLLHIGNVANNAYLNAKLLNRAGLDCDVLCYDYYHIMGCPALGFIDDQYTTHRAAFTRSRTLPLTSDKLPSTVQPAA